MGTPPLPWAAWSRQGGRGQARQEQPCRADAGLMPTTAGPSHTLGPEPPACQPARRPGANGCPCPDPGLRFWEGKRTRTCTLSVAFSSSLMALRRFQQLDGTAAEPGGIPATSEGAVLTAVTSCCADAHQAISRSFNTSVLKIRAPLCASQMFHDHFHPLCFESLSFRSKMLD